MELNHYEESLKCCNEALRVSNESPEVYYRKSQSIFYNTASTLEDLQNSLNDIETALKMNPNEERYQEHAKSVKQRIEEVKDLYKRVIQSIIETKSFKSEEAVSYSLLQK